MQKGQALISLLFFIVIAVSITSAATVMIVSSISQTTKLEQGTIALAVAESGAENAILRLLRNRQYCGEVLPVGDGSATISIVDAASGCTGSSPFTITVVGASGDFQRTIRVVLTYTINTLTINSWQEI